MTFDNVKRVTVGITACVITLLFSPLGHANNKPAAELQPMLALLLFEEEREPISLNEAARFLTQTTFGPTYDEIVALTNSSYEAWLVIVAMKRG